MAGFYYVLDEEARVLFVDDDPILREFARVNLASLQATVEVAEDGAEALSRLQNEPYDIVVSDLEMPRMDGFQLLSSIRDTPRIENIPVVVATGREDVAAIDRAFELGATAFVVKPLNWRLLSYQLRFQLRAARTEAKLRAAVLNGLAPARCA